MSVLDTALAAAIAPVPGTDVRFQPRAPAWKPANGAMPELVGLPPNAQTVLLPVASEA